MIAWIHNGVCRWMNIMRATGQKGVYQEHLCEGLFNLQPCPDHSNKSQSQHIYIHPIFQTWCMFLGEMLCLFAFKASVVWKQCKGVAVENSPFNCLLFLFPAWCDMIATGMTVAGLTMTYPSSFQMMRGAVIIFTSVFSVIFLGKKLWWNHWLGMLFVFAGLCVTGVSDSLFERKEGLSNTTQLSGDLLVITAQVIVAVQMVYEEKVVKKYNISALQAVGWEGVWGLVFLSLFLVPFYYIPYSFYTLRPPQFENAIDAVWQTINSWEIGVATVCLIISLSLFNFSGMSVTKEMSATTRKVLDSVRVLFVWAVSLAVKWNNFQYLQPVGYFLLLIGILVYYNLVLLPRVVRIWKKLKKEESDSDEEPLLTGNGGTASPTLF